VASGRFRHDLFYRVNVIAMELPSLQQRKDDLPVLVEHLLHKLAEDTGQQVDISDSAIEALQNYHFPGNVRELENILQRAAALCDEQSIQVENLGLEADNKPTASTGATLETYATKDIDDLEAHLQGVEQSILKRVMEEENGNRAAVAKRLKLTQRQLRYKLSKLGLED
jgi:two-component system response regulator PilR (NtrC family)